MHYDQRYGTNRRICIEGSVFVQSAPKGDKYFDQSKARGDKKALSM